MYYSLFTGDGPIMPQRKTTKSGETAMRDRRSIAVKLTDEELKALKQMALDTDSTSVEIATNAIREVLRKHQARK